MRAACCSSSPLASAPPPGWPACRWAWLHSTPSVQGPWRGGVLARSPRRGPHGRAQIRFAPRPGPRGGPLPVNSDPSAPPCAVPARPLAARVLGSGGPVRASACLASSVPTPRSGSGSGSPTLVAGRRWWTRSMGPGDTRTDHEIVHREAAFPDFFFCLLKKEPRGAPSISRLKSGKSAPGLPASLPLARLFVTNII